VIPLTHRDHYECCFTHWCRLYENGGYLASEMWATILNQPEVAEIDKVVTEHRKMLRLR
jgi:hypothetical protein